ncbi:DUF1499 domain-containing protein [Rhizobium helianthi]|uniref:DUF1499 domain-containing protein n=1 Tax=Rhizobium helianthi TaxID=1132695 RepID=A0ABW4M555_9HYPH
MAVRFVRPVSSAAYSAKRLASGAFLLLVMALLAHRFGPLTTPGFLALVLLSAAISAISVILALRGLSQLWSVGAKGGGAATKALLLALPSLALFGAGLWLYETKPALFDVSSDLADPPSWKKQPVADQLWLNQPIFVSPADRALQEDAYPELTGRRYEGARDRVYEAVIKVGLSNRIQFEKDKQSQSMSAKSKPKSGVVPPPELSDAEQTPPVPDVVPVPLPRPSPVTPSSILQSQARGDLLLQGTVRTLVLGLPFDVVVRLREEEETVMVDVRVASRYGSHDLGISAELAQGFLRSLDSELLGIATE